MSQSWNSPDRDITPESTFMTRRRWLGAAALGLSALGGGVYWRFRHGTADEVLATRQEAPAGEDLYPAALNADFAEADRPMTDKDVAARHTNFYEFSSLKDVWRHIDGFHPTPWEVEVSGMVARPRTYDIDDLVRAFPLEERVYRLRCVESWAMVIPWTGFPLAALLRKAEPLAEAKYVRFVSFERPSEASKQRDKSKPWPYTEGLTLAEATNPLAFIATGIYGKPLLKQHGAPVRLVVPWKYGFKSGKSIVRIELTDEQPATFWNTVQGNEYDFEANVDPDKPHPRWSQKVEEMLGTKAQHKTTKYNGYGEWVAKLY